jgi:hypothetical protein
VVRVGWVPDAAVVDESSIFRHDPGSAGATAAAAALAAPPAIPAAEEGGSRVGALSAAVLVALGGGLVWAGVVIVTKYDIGILAWLVGAATGYAVHRLGGGTVTVADRAIAAGLAAGGILLGKYVIFVHELKDALRTIFHTNAAAVGYFDTRELSFFVHHFGEVVRWTYILWIGLAMLAAFRVSGGQNVFGRRAPKR